jgi:hypothetical protein
MNESTIERTVTLHAKRLGWISLKLSGAHDRGKPDRMYLRRGVTVFIEFKAPGKLPTALQNKWIKDLREAGFKATWIDNFEDGKKFFTGLEP